MPFLITGVTGLVGSHGAGYSSGRLWVIQEVLDSFLKQATRKGIGVDIASARLRPSDVMVLEGEPAKARTAVGRKVGLPLERTLKDCLRTAVSAYRLRVLLIIERSFRAPA